MSLILEALKKLEREKKAPERGFLVTASAAWPSRRGVGAGAAYLLAGLALAGAGAVGAWLVLGTTRPPPRVEAPPPATLPSTTSPPPARAALPVAPARPATLPLATPWAPPASPSAVPPALHATPAPTPEPAEAAASEAPPDATPRADAPLRLEAISRRDGKPVAVLSGRLVHEGDSFDDVRVLRIGDAEVEVEIGGQRRVLGF